MNSYVLSALALVIFTPLILIFFLPKDKKFFEKKIVRGFGIGAYTALIIILLKESSEVSIMHTGLWYVIGILLSIVIGFFFVHHHHTHGGHTHNKKDIFRILGSDILHNIVDGIVIIGGFTLGLHAGIMTTIGILLHQSLQQIGQQVLLVDHGIKPIRALVYSFLVSLTLLSGLFISLNETMLYVCMALSAGIISVTVYEDSKHLLQRESMFGYIVGFFLMWFIVFIVPHVH